MRRARWPNGAPRFALNRGRPPAHCAPSTINAGAANPPRLSQGPSPDCAPLRVAPSGLQGQNKKEKRRGFWPRRILWRIRSEDQNRRSTAWSACEASDSAVEDSCWRVCRARGLGASLLGSASTSASSPVCRGLIIDLVNAWRFCTIDRFEPKAEACERSDVRASCRPSRRVSSAELSENSADVAAPMLRSAALMPLAFCDWIEIDEVLISLNTSLRVSPLSRLTPLKLASSASLSS